MGYPGWGGLGPRGKGPWSSPNPPVPPKYGEKPTLSISFFPASNPVPPIPSTQIQSESIATPTGVDIMGRTSGPKRTLQVDMGSMDPRDQGSVKKKKFMTSTTMEMVTMSPTPTTPSRKNPQNSPKTPLVMGQGVSNPHGGIRRTTCNIGGRSYITASSISPLKHLIVSENLDFCYNDFVTNFEQSKNRNRQNTKTLKMNVVAASRDAKLASNRLFPTYDPKKEIMEFVVVMPPTRDDNPPESLLDPSEFQVSTLQMDLSKIKNVDKINVSKMTNQVVSSSVMKLEREKGKLRGTIDKLKVDLENEKEKEKVANNMCKELEKMIKKLIL